jgi:hypothetical protein
LALVEHARAFACKDDGLTALAPVRDRFPDFAGLLASEPEGICSAHCAPQRASAGRSEMTASSPASSAKPGVF